MHYYFVVPPGSVKNFKLDRRPTHLAEVTITAVTPDVTAAVLTSPQMCWPCQPLVRLYRPLLLPACKWAAIQLWEIGPLGSQSGCFNPLSEWKLLHFGKLDWRLTFSVSSSYLHPDILVQQSSLNRSVELYQALDLVPSTFPMLYV